MSGHGNIIVNDLLCFVQNNGLSLSLSTICRLCLESYSSKEIFDAMQVLTDATKDSIVTPSYIASLSTRGNDNCSQEESTMKIICRFLSLTNHVNMPQFVSNGKRQPKRGLYQDALSTACLWDELRELKQAIINNHTQVCNELRDLRSSINHRNKQTCINCAGSNPNDGYEGDDGEGKGDMHTNEANGAGMGHINPSPTDEVEALMNDDNMRKRKREGDAGHGGKLPFQPIPTYSTLQPAVNPSGQSSFPLSNFNNPPAGDQQSNWFSNPSGEPFLPPPTDSATKPAKASRRGRVSLKKEVEGVIEQKFQAIRSLQETTADLLSHVIRHSGVMPPVTQLPSDIVFPLNTLADVAHLEEKLEDPSTQQTVVNHLSLVGGSSAKECTRRILKTVLSNKLAQHMNWKGKGDKIAFSNFKIRDVINRAVRTNSLTVEATNYEIEAQIKAWLRFAPAREGGRGPSTPKAQPPGQLQSGQLEPIRSDLTDIKLSPTHQANIEAAHQASIEAAQHQASMEAAHQASMEAAHQASLEAAHQAAQQQHQASAPPPPPPPQQPTM